MKTKFNELSNAIRFLSIDAVQKANSGHPGMPMGMADVATVLFKYYLRFNPDNPGWVNRDRFILSAGHGSMLLYSLLYLTGYKSVSLDDIKNFRQLDSVCAGHPEYIKHSGIETTTGPLGQGLSNAVGLAIAEEIYRNKFGSKLIDHKTFVIASDGDMMEGISHEAMSLAGHLKLKNLIVFFDNNNISIDGSTSLSVSDNYKKRFSSYGWNYIEINGHVEKQIVLAIKKSLKSNKPTLISCKTKIGFGSPNKQGKSSSHGSPLGEDEIKLVRKKLKWPYQPFQIPERILNEWRLIGKKAANFENDWNKKFFKLNSDFKAEFNNFRNKNFSDKLKKLVQTQKEKYFNEKPSIATRQCSMMVLEELKSNIPNLIGGSADLSGSNNTKTKSSNVINSKNFKGNYIHYGVREHGMAGAMNGIALYDNLVPYGGTFLIFSDYCKPSIRLSALMKLRVIYVFSHDSIGLGEDGPTHQPIEQLTGLRSIPNIKVFRPADMSETLESWEAALNNVDGPSAIVLSRQKLPFITPKFTEENQTLKGGYEINITSHESKITLLASGSELGLALEVQQDLKKLSIDSKLISMPCQELFDMQSDEYKSKILEKDNLFVSIEAGNELSWKKYLKPGDISVSINEFGSSAPYKQLYDKYKLTSNKIVSRIQNKLRN